MAFGINKVEFLQLPTPLEYLFHISRDLGIEFYIKRDDLTNLGGGGNKLRKLEYLLADAQRHKATALLTVGGAQTNHGRLTAAVAAKYGMKCVIVCIDEYPGELSANLLLDRLMGAEVVLKKDDRRNIQTQLDETVYAVKSKYEAAGERVYEIPAGGSTVLGMLGYFDCALEIVKQVEQIGLKEAEVYCAVGSLGTYMGLFCGLSRLGWPLTLRGISVAPRSGNLCAELMSYYSATRLKYGLEFDAQPTDFRIETEYVRGAYNNPDPDVRKAIRYMANREGILLDPCYTGKAFAAIIDMVEEGKIRSGDTVIFVHTGGIPGLYTKHHRIEFERELINGITILD